MPTDPACEASYALSAPSPLEHLMSTPYGPQGPQQPLPPLGGHRPGPAPYPQQYAPQGPYQGPPQGPPPGFYATQPAHGYPPPPAAEPRNGLGLAAIICALVAVPCAWVPILFFVGGPLAIVAIALGAAGQARVSRGRATNGRMTAFAILLGIFALLGAFNNARTILTYTDSVKDSQQQMMDCVNKATSPDEIAACAP
ncbi:DUF4190 domain-containing protein [Microbispora sp. RL4-1S]|uniref:DUF4190 domain-containing protein n=1 Tax=Microbispora oryzae TaxID=2806554 RepID=A0A940WPA3_9ACTN|nr:DUF4190 domain-containing protein [Microbispora oryzae]MBP2704394.1 DUF4190 domain-containing protein [Microbispora oryzae]